MTRMGRRRRKERIPSAEGDHELEHHMNAITRSPAQPKENQHSNRKQPRQYNPHHGERLSTAAKRRHWEETEEVERSWTESRRKMQRQRERNHLTNHVKRQTRVISIVYYLLDPLSSGTIGYQWWSTTVIWRGWSQWPPGQQSWWCLRSISHLLNGVNEGMFLSDLVELCSTKDVEEHTKTCFDHQQLVRAQSSIQHSLKQHTITFIIHQHSHAPMTKT